MNTKDMAKNLPPQDDDSQEQIPEVPETTKGGDKVSVSKKDLQALFDRLSALEADKKSDDDIRSGRANSPFTRTKKKMVKLHKWQGKLVLGYEIDEYGESVHQKYDALRPGKDKSYEVINLILDGVKEPVEVELLAFRNSPTEWFNVVKTEIEEDIHNFGAVNVRDEVKGRFTETEDIVPLDVKYEYRTYTLDLGDGREVPVHERFINL